MRLPTRVGNPCLATLLAGSGIASLEQFAQLVNRHGADEYQLQLFYDRNSVIRWLKGAECKHPQVVAEVLSRAWGICIPAPAIWPTAGGGAAPILAHQHPWVAAHTVAGLSMQVCRDVLTDPTVTAPPLVDGSVLLATIRRWLAAEPGRLTGRADGNIEVTAGLVERLDSLVVDLTAAAARIGSRWVRDAAVGHLHCGVDLLRHGRYDTATGNQLLAMVADLAGAVAVFSADAGRPDLAQTYAVFGLHAAYESTHPTAVVIVAAILGALSEQQASNGRGDVGRALLDLAIGHLASTAEHRPVRAVLVARRAAHLATVQPAPVGEVVNAIDLALALNQPDPGSPPARVPASLNDATGAGVHHAAATAYLTLARSAEPNLAATYAGKAEATVQAAVSWHQADATACALLTEARTLLGHCDALTRA